MQLAKQLADLNIGSFPCAVRYNAEKHKWEKYPITVNREHWAATAARPYSDPATNWADVQVIGVPVPEGIVVIDLDCYKGVTPEDASRLLGADIPWEAALIQTTMSGGRHYAFRMPEWNVKQGNNFGSPGSGVDTRVGGKGFICSGGGYAPGPDGFGIMRFAYPESLPMLPDACRGALEQKEVERPEAPTLPDEDDRDIDTVKAALSHIDPTERDTWRDIGFALKHYFHDDEPTGFAIWDAWSAGEFWADGCPASYTPEHQPAQWNSFKAVRDGATITVATLFHMAMRGGWRPPARFDTSAAFGAGALEADSFSSLIDRILEEGADTRKTQELLDMIRASGCNEMQAVLLRNELKAMLRTAKVLDKDLSSIIDRETSTKPVAATPSGYYGKNHTENAGIWLQAHYPNNTLIRSQEVWYAYNGKCWREVEDAEIDHQITMAMLSSMPQKSTVSGTYQMVASMVYKTDVDMHESPPGLVVFDNGVLELNTGRLLPHDKQYLTTKKVPYNFNPDATAPRWSLFVNEVFEGDPERIALLQEWMGYMLSPSYEHQKVMLLLGPKRSGKGTIGNILADLVGHVNYTGCSLSSFADDDYLDSLQHKTVAFSGDTAKNISYAIVDRVIERLKKISGNDYVDFKRKYKGRMTCKLPARITLAGNHVPRLFDDSEALATRMLVLPFEVSFLNREDTFLLPALQAEIEGIALWALQGLARLRQRGRFTVPSASLSEMEYIAESYSPLRAFIAACCTTGGDGTVESRDLYEAYRKWALDTGEEKLLARKTFINAFKDAVRGHGCRYGSHRAADGTTFRGFEGLTINYVPSGTEGAFQPRAVK